MKKELIFLLSACLLLSLSACAKNAPVSAETTIHQAVVDDVGQLKTMGDVFRFGSSEHGFSETKYVYVFDMGGNIYRAVADLPADVSEAIQAVDIFDETYDEQIYSAVAPLEITRLDNLSEMTPSQEELAALVGRNVQDLLNEGWSFWYWNMDSMEGGMYHGPFSYHFEFEGSVDHPEDFDESQADALTVRSVSFEGIGNAVDEILNGVEG